MKIARKYRHILMAATLLAMTPLASNAQAEPNKFDAAVASTVRILAITAQGEVSSGTGWVIAASDDQKRAGAAVVMTAQHVVQGAVRVTVLEQNATLADQKIAIVLTPNAGTLSRDVAFLEVKGLKEPALKLDTTQMERGDQVWAAGYTRASDLNEDTQLAKSAAIKGGSFSKNFDGAVNNYSGASIKQGEFDAPILAGYSGGPLLNKCGQVIGLVIKDGGHVPVGESGNIALAQGVNIAISASELAAAAATSGVSYDTASACDVVPPVVQKACPTAGVTVDGDGKPCLPVPAEPTLWEKIAKILRQPSTLGIISVAGLLVAAGAGWFVMRGGRTAPAVPGGLDRTIPLNETESVKQILQAPTVNSIRISGRGPGGEPIDMRFSADELAGTGVVLGIEGDNGAIIPDTRASAFVSRRHARLSYDGRNYLIEDNKSSNGTFVGGTKLTPHSSRALVNGDSIKLADVTLNIAID